MMNTTKKLMTLLLALLTTSMAVAYDFEVDGIYYLANGSEATVTSRTPYYTHSSDYTGDVVIPETVTYNGVTYSVTAIGKDAFYYCTELTSIHIPKSIKRVVGNMCFYSCSSLSKVDIESLESWCNIDFEISPGYTFSYSNPLSYAHHLYMNGEELTELVIPSGVTRIGTSAFCELSSISRLEIPNSVTSIGNEAFVGCGGFVRLDIPDLETWMKIDIQGYNSNPMGYARHIYLGGIEMSHELVIPETTKMISNGAFYGCKMITSVSIPSSVEKIGAYAFFSCDSLEIVNIQDIAAWCNIVFENTESNPISNAIPSAWWDEQEVAVYVNGTPITQLDLPEGVSSISDYAFSGASFSHITFPNTLVSIGNYAFQYNRLLENVVFPKTLVSIGDYAFQHNYWLDDVILPESLKTLGKGIFYDCTFMKKAQINAELEVIPESMFESCVDLADVSLPSTLQKIGEHAFSGCYDITTMPMTDSLKFLGDYSFAYSGIKYLKTGKTLTSIGQYAFHFNLNLTKVEIDDPVTTLGEGAFSDANIRTMIVGNGVHRIPKSFCKDCDELISVRLGNAIDTLEERCFSYCKNLNTIICKAEVPPVMNGAEDSFFWSTVFQNATLYVPFASLEAYKAANVWKKFQTIVGVDFDINPCDVNGDGSVTISDADNVIVIIINGGNGHDRIDEHGNLIGDVNHDGVVNISDLNLIINLIINN